MKKVSLALTVTLLTLVATVALAETAKSEQPYLTKVESKKVCMINNGYMKKDQIPVPIGKRTYYGCCEMCVKALNADEKKRVAVDPVSGKSVDKSEAVIGADPNGDVFYFENEENLKKYKPAAN